MGELGGVVSYLYWSERRIEAILTDNGIQLPESSSKITSPSVYGLAPVYERSVAGRQRASIADLIERSLGQSVISRFDGDPGPRYAKGLGTLVFGQFINAFEYPRESAKHRALMFTPCDYDDFDQGSVAICLFGSMENFAGYVNARDSQHQEGWTSSSAPDVLAFLQGQWIEGKGYPSTREEVAIEALMIADGQGMKGTGNLEPLKGWRRSFTYGDIQDVAEWLAEIYLDVDLVSSGRGREDGFRRIIVGAPVWIRTPRLRAIRLYNEYSRAELEAMGPYDGNAPSGSFGLRLRSRFIRRFVDRAACYGTYAFGSAP